MNTTSMLSLPMEVATLHAAPPAYGVHDLTFSRGRPFWSAIRSGCSVGVGVGGWVVSSENSGTPTSRARELWVGNTISSACFTCWCLPALCAHKARMFGAHARMHARTHARKHARMLLQRASSRPSRHFFVQRVPTAHSQGHPPMCGRASPPWHEPRTHQTATRPAQQHACARSLRACPRPPCKRAHRASLLPNGAAAASSASTCSCC